MHKIIYTLLTTLTFSIAAQAQTFDWARHVKTIPTGEVASVNDVTADANGNVYIIGDFEFALDLDGDNIADISSPSGNNDAIFIAKYSNVGALVWSMAIPGSATCHGEGIAVDVNNNVYVTGDFRGTNVEFDPLGSGLLLSSSASDDIFVAKYSSDGVCQWAFDIGNGSTSNEGHELAVDASGNVFVAGRFDETNVDFDPSSGGTAFQSSTGASLAFLAKYDTNGNYQWALSIGDAGSDYGRSVAVDGNGDVYWVGNFDANGNNINFDPIGGSQTLTTISSSTDIFLAKYSTNGHCQWAHSFGELGSTNGDYGYGVATDASNNVYITGQAEGQTDFDPSGSTAFLCPTTTPVDEAFLASYNSAGTFRWVARIGDVAETSENGSEVTVSNNAVYVTGRFQGNVDIYDATSNSTPQVTHATGSTTTYSAIWAKFELNGNYINSFFTDAANDEEAMAIHFSNNKLYWAGTFEGTTAIDFDPSTGTSTLTNGSTIDDGFVIQYDDTPVSTLESIAITEWLSNPTGNEGSSGNQVEYVELYNFGVSTVNLNGWKIEDESGNIQNISSTDLFLAAGEYIIITRNKSDFEANWLNGCSNSKVIEVSGLRLTNNEDEIIITDGSNNTIWSVAYANDETTGRATHYTEVTYANRTFGSQATPGVVRNGNDVTGSLGYQKNNITTDPNARTAVNGDVGSPLGAMEVPGITRGSTVLFDGTSGQGQLPFIIDPANNFTAELWFKAQNGGTNPIFLHQNNGTGTGRQILRIAGTNNLRTQLGGINTTSSTTLVDNEWYHAAVTWDGSTVYLYLNGRLEATSNIAPEAANGTIVLASNRGGSNRFLDGNIDELRFWTTARTETEIRENMHLTLQGCETGLEAYYQFNENAGSVLKDKTDNGYNGSLAGTTTWEVSGINAGHDRFRNSVSQSIVTLAGASTQNFTNANLDIEFKEHSIAEEITVTYQNFVPNTTTGLNNTIMPTDIQWTITYSELNPVTRLMDLTFTYPANTFTNLEAKKYDLYRRNHNSEGDWIRVGAASDITSNTITFRNIDKTGQFMVQARSTDLVSDVRGSMLFFNNSYPQYINIPSSASLSFDRTDPITIETWAKPNPNASIMTLFEKIDGATGRGYSFYIQANRLRFQLINTAGTNVIDVVTNTDVIDNQWQHIAMTYDGSSDAAGVQFYIDGVLLGSFVGANTLTGTTVTAADAKIAAKNDATFGFDGYLEEFRVWNATRSEDELRSTMHLTLKGNEPGLVAYYQFNRDTWDGSNYTVVDARATNNGASVNMVEANSYASEVAVAGGNSQKLIVPAAGPFVANYDKIPASISFGTGMAPDGDVWVSRLETEKPNGWSTVTGDVDNEYFVVRNFGNNQTFAPLDNIQFSNIAYINATDAAQPEATSPLQVHKRSSISYGATWGSSLANANTATAGTSGSVTFDNSANITSFSQFVLINAAQNSDLPIELLDFMATRKDNDEVALNWSTASELNNKGFEVQRMLENETEFTVVGWVDGMGTSMEVINYQLIDDNAFDGISYYRLRQVDFDGTAELTEMRVVEGMASSQFAHTEVYPNPVKNELNLRFTQIKKKQSAHIQIFDARGQRIYSQRITPNPQQTHIINDVENFAAGIYLLSIELDGEKFVQKFVKQ